MHSTALAALAALVLLPLVALQGTPPPAPAGQDPAGQKPVPAEPKLPSRTKRVSEADRVRAEVLGVWQLDRTELGGRSYVGGDCGGYLTVVPEYATLIARLAEPLQGRPNLEDQAFTAGTYRWSYDDSRLQFTLQTLLHGSDIDDPEGHVLYEAPGSRRDYDIIVSGNDLTLTRAGGQTRMFFRRLTRGIPPAPKDDAAPAASPAGSTPPAKK